MKTKSRKSTGNRKLFDRIVIVKKSIIKYRSQEGKPTGEIIIRSLYLKGAIDKRVRVIIRTHYSR